MRSALVKAISRPTALLTLLSMAACGPSYVVYRTKLDELFDANLAGFAPPSAARIKQGSETREFRGADSDAVMHAALIVLMQSGVIAYASSRDRVIVRLDVFPPIVGEAGTSNVIHWQHVGSPMVVMVEPTGPDTVRVYTNWLEELYARTDRPDVAAIGLKPRNKEVMADRFLDRLAVQLLQGDNIGKLAPVAAHR